MSLGVADSLRAMFANALLVRQEDGVEVDLQVGKTVTKAPRYMRTQLWLGVLQRYPGLGNQAAKQYHNLLRKAVPEIIADDIAKDVGRTFPSIRRFKTAAGQMSLLRVLRAYAVHDPEVNYCQGMNFLAALLLMWMPSEAEAFGGLVVLMQERGLRELYKKDLSTLQARLWQIGQLLPRKLAEHLEANSVLPVLYASSWLLTAFSADFPIFWSSRVMDVILTDCYIEPMMKVVLGIMRTCQPALLQSTDMERMVRFIKAGTPRWPHTTLQEVLTDSLAMEWTPEQAAVLNQTEGIESVVQAVARVYSANEAKNGEQPETSPRSASQDQAPRNASGMPRRNTSLSWASRMSSTLNPLPSMDSLPRHQSASSPANLSSANLQEELMARGSSHAACAHASSEAALHLLDSHTTASLGDCLADEERSDLREGRHSSALHRRPLRSRTDRSSNGSFGDFTGSTDFLRAFSEQSLEQSCASGQEPHSKPSPLEHKEAPESVETKDWNRDFWEEENCERTSSLPEKQASERLGPISGEVAPAPSTLSETSFGSFQGGSNTPESVPASKRHVHAQATAAPLLSRPPAAKPPSRELSREARQEKSLLDEGTSVADLLPFDSLSLQLDAGDAGEDESSRPQQNDRLEQRLEDELSRFSFPQRPPQ